MSDPRKFKGSIIVEGSVELPAESINRVLIIDSSNEIASSSVTTTELDLLSGATGSLSVTEQKVTNLITLSGVAANEPDLGNFTGSIIANDSTVKQALQQLETSIESLPDPMEYKGAWNASTNTPTLTDGVGSNGDVYYVSVAGTQFSPAISFEIGDKAVYNGSTAKYEKWDMTDAVASVNGQTGVVVLDTDDIAEGSALYFTDERAQDAVGGIVASSSKVSLIYNDGTPNIIADIVAASLVNADISASAAIELSKLEALTANRAVQTDASGELVVSAVTSTELGYVSGATSNIQAQLNALPSASAGDINQTSFNLANNQGSAANVTGLAFANGSVRSFNALVSVTIDATADLFEVFELLGVQRGGDWQMSVSGTGDNSLVVFSITNAGQVQYTSGNYSGFSSGTVKFRAIVTNV